MTDRRRSAKTTAKKVVTKDCTTNTDSYNSRLIIAEKKRCTRFNLTKDTFHLRLYAAMTEMVEHYWSYGFAEITNVEVERPGRITILYKTSRPAFAYGGRIDDGTITIPWVIDAIVTGETFMGGIVGASMTVTLNGETVVSTDDYTEIVSLSGWDIIRKVVKYQHMIENRINLE